MSGRLRGDLPFRRIALVLSGGGALGAYEVGVLKVLERVGLRPAIVAGVSVGAINAVVWLAHDLRTEPLVEVWRNLRPPTIGIRWLTLAIRATGGVVLALAALEVVLTLAGSYELRLSRWLGGDRFPRGDVVSTLLDAAAWGVVGLGGAAAMGFSRRLDEMGRSFVRERDVVAAHRWWGRALLGLGLVHLLLWGFGVPWPHRFSATLIAIGGLVWLANRPTGGGEWMRRLLIRILPETGGRGLWGSRGRRRFVQSLLAGGDAERLLARDVHWITSACALDDGRMRYFVNWDPDERFRREVAAVNGEVVVVRSVAEIVEATVASSAIPVVFEPVPLDGRDLVDGGVFSNQPLHAVLADAADAVLVVLLTPSAGPSPMAPRANLLELGARLLELGNWRDLQAELRSLPDGWSREGDPARVCVVEPERPLEGGVLGFSPARAIELVARGERDAEAALERSGWLEPEDERVGPSDGFA